MTAAELYQAGRLDEAIDVLGSEVRGDPTNVRLRTFLFELLCFAGELDRAEKQLDVLARGGREAEMGALLYRSALHAQRLRVDRFSGQGLPPSTADPPAVSGTLNGEPFTSLVDADPRVGARMELFAAGQYTWIPFAQVESVHMEAPSRLRDLLWAPAKVKTAVGSGAVELGEVLVPVLTPRAAEHSDDEVRLGRVTVLEDLEGGTPVPVGQRILIADDREVPILEVRELRVHSAQRPS